MTELEWVVTTGRTVAEAREVALDQLGVDEQEAEVEVVQEEQTGLFGRLKVEAKVKARIRPTTPRAKVDRRERRRKNPNRKNRKGGPNGGDRSQDAKAREVAGAGSSGAGGGAGDQGRHSEASAQGNDKEPAAAGSGSSEGGQQQRRNQQGQSPSTAGSSGNRSGRRRRGGGQQQGGSKVASTSTDDQDAAPVADVEAQREAVVEFLGGLLTAMDRTDATVTAQTEGDGTIVAEVNGDELGLLVGPKGQTLQAMHELTRSVVQRRFVGESHARINLDVGGYRKRRAEALARFTEKLAEDVLASGVAKALDPMAASDRKVVHDTINEIDGVRTISEGEEPNRRVVITKA